MTHTLTTKQTHTPFHGRPKSMFVPLHKWEKVKECAGVFDLPMGSCNRTRVDLKALLKSKCLSLGGSLFPLVLRDHIKPLFTSKQPYPSAWGPKADNHDRIKTRLTETILSLLRLTDPGKVNVKNQPQETKHRGQLRAC